MRAADESDEPAEGREPGTADAAAGGHDEVHHPHLHDAIDVVRDAAIEAEFDTGVREETVAEARASIVRRLGRMTGGFFVVILGIILMPLPGPGLVIVAAGLAILSKDFAWAERTLVGVQRRIPRNAHGQIPRTTWVLMSVTAVVGLSVSLWWSFLR